MKRSKILCLIMVLFLPGCAHRWLPQTVAALGTNTNAIVIKVSTPWGSAELYRNYSPP